MEFKRCSSCGTVWETRDKFLADPCAHLNGYQVNYADLGAGLFLFTHRVSSCGTTMSIQADQFTDLHDGPVFAKSLRGTPDCPKLCIRIHELDACPAHCECAFVREVLQKVLNWPKDPGCKAAQRKGNA